MIELFHGPTAAFKDFGARFLAACLAPAARPRRTRSDRAGRDIRRHRRRGRCGVSPAQPDFASSSFIPMAAFRRARPINSAASATTCTRCASRGSFDDCQALVKRALSDPLLKHAVPLTSANSISLGRLLPQITYYAHAALAHWLAHGRRLNFVVPTGNLGNALACVFARATGLPVGDIVLATNANRVLPEFFAGGEYAPRASVTTLANAMDVGAPSNFERLRWFYADDGMLRKALTAQAVDDDEIRDEIRSSQNRYGTLICPHTATATRVLARLRAGGDSRDYVVVATAHPAKFEQVIEPLIATPISVPPALQALLDRPARSEPLAADYAALRKRLVALAA